MRGGSGMPINLSGALSGDSFTLKAVNFCHRELNLRQTLACNLDTISSN